MHKLDVLPDSPMVDALMRRLEDASIEATRSTEKSVGDLYLGGAPTVSVWIVNAEDLPRAAEVLRAVQAERTAIKCASCGYDMQGHAGHTHCPECGHDLTAAAPDVPCPHCNEPVPAGFELCWSCGGTLGDTHGTE